MPANDLNFEKTVLKNGAPLYVMHMPHARSVAAGFLVKAGTRDEAWPKEAGLSHALEHMLWVGGTNKFPTSKDLTGYLEDIGGYGYPWTSKESTLHSFRVPTEHVERGFAVLQEVLFSPSLNAEKIPTEMQNIIQEIRMHHDIPESFLADEAMAFGYGTHPLSRQIAGTEASVAAFTRDDFASYLSKMYVPSRFVFLSVGNLDAARAKTLFEQYLCQASAAPWNRAADRFSGVEEPRKTFTRDLKQTHIALIATLGAARETATKAMDLFSVMLSGGMSFPLFQEVREKLGLCYHISASTELYSDVSTFYLYIGTDPNRSSEAIRVTREVIERCRRDEALLNRAKELVRGRLALRYENPLSVLENAAFEVGTGEEPKGSVEILKEIEALSIDDIAAAADLYLGQDKLKEVLLGPEIK